MLGRSLVCRAFHTSLPHLVRRAAKNPGMRYRLKELGNVEGIEEEDETFADADFNRIHLSHKQHEQDMQKERNRIRRLIIKRKYFPEEHLPNLLTYAEKEQMRILHARDPEEWTYERLSESFPATPDVVEKVVRAKWKPSSVERIKRHDEKVLRNWEMIQSEKDGQRLPQRLQEHLQKFAQRNLKDLQQQTKAIKNWAIRPELPKPKCQEFLSIITSSSKYATPEAQPPKMLESSEQIKQNDSLQSRKNDAENETYLLDQIKDKRRMRLQELMEQKLTPQEQQIIKEQSHVHVERHAAMHFQNPSGTGVVPMPEQHTRMSNFIEKFQGTEIVVSVEDQKRYEMSKVKDRIYIPRKLWRKGATYRVDDCYYADDGEFLYRVPGMTG